MSSTTVLAECPHCHHLQPLERPHKRATINAPCQLCRQRFTVQINPAAHNSTDAALPHLGTPADTQLELPLDPPNKTPPPGK